MIKVQDEINSGRKYVYILFFFRLHTLLGMDKSFDWQWIKKEELTLGKVNPKNSGVSTIWGTADRITINSKVELLSLILK